MTNLSQKEEKYGEEVFKEAAKYMKENYNGEFEKDEVLRDWEEIVENLETLPKNLPRETSAAMEIGVVSALLEYVPEYTQSNQMGFKITKKSHGKFIVEDEI